jgi:hypothetical protein
MGFSPFSFFFLLFIDIFFIFSTLFRKPPKLQFVFLYRDFHHSTFFLSLLNKYILKMNLFSCPCYFSGHYFYELFNERKISKFFKVSGERFKISNILLSSAIKSSNILISLISFRVPCSFEISSSFSNSFSLSSFISKFDLFSNFDLLVNLHCLGLFYYYLVFHY